MIVGTSADELARAISALRRGQIVAIPTDTVYGLAVDPSVPGATASLFALKRRPATSDLPVLVAGLSQAESLVAPGAIDEREPAGRVVRRLWPGPLTIVLGRASGLGWELGERSTTIGLRCPDDDVVRALCGAVGPLAVTSANEHGEAPLCDATSVSEVFGVSLLVVDGGRRGAPPSTVVDLSSSEPHVLRHGVISAADVRRAMGDGAEVQP
ncbi:MAG: L-threonylcarbamoyladenylate synthase [Acidimicrobiales bacterium]